MACLNCEKDFEEWDEFYFYWCVECTDFFMEHANYPKEEAPLIPVPFFGNTSNCIILDEFSD